MNGGFKTELMKHNFKNGKWSPPNGTFVRVPNEQIPEVIQMLRENGQITEEDDTILVSENCVYFEEGEWGSCISNRIEGTEIPFPDFKALVTGKLPESWCIQCTEESMKHEYWYIMCKVTGSTHAGRCEKTDLYYGKTYDGFYIDDDPFGEVLQMPTWAALNPVEDLEANPHECPNCSWQCSCVDQPCSCCNSPESHTDDQLINELKSRGYLGTKEICIETDIQVTANRLDNGEPVTGYFVSRTGRFGACPCIIVPTHDLEEPDKEYRIDYATARLNPVEYLHEKPCDCKPVTADIFASIALIRVLKKRGYTISKIY